MRAMTKNTKALIIGASVLILMLLTIDFIHNFIRMRHETASNPYAAEKRREQAIEDAKFQPVTNTTSQKP